MSTPTPGASDAPTTPPASPVEASRPPIYPPDFGTPKWTLLCGCAADEHDNRVWCTAHATKRIDERFAASNAVSDPTATLPWQDAVNALFETGYLYRGIKDKPVEPAIELIRRACEQWARSATEHWRQHDAEMHKALAAVGLERQTLREQLALCRSVLEECRPMVKAHLLEMERFGPGDESIVGRIEQALKEGV